MSAKYWYNANEESTGCQVYLLVSPDHYGKRISDALANIELIKAQLAKGGITYDSQEAAKNPELILLTENGEPKIEMGDTDFDKHVMRTLLDARTDVSRDTLENRLKTAGFYEGLPTCF